MAVLFGLPHDVLTIARLSAVPMEAFRENLRHLRDGRDHKKRWQIRRHFSEYLCTLEAHWQPMVLKKAS